MTRRIFTLLKNMEEVICRSIGRFVLKNKAWLTAFAAAVLTLVYDILGMCGVLPAVSEALWHRLSCC